MRVEKFHENYVILQLFWHLLREFRLDRDTVIECVARPNSSLRLSLTFTSKRNCSGKFSLFEALFLCARDLQMQFSISSEMCLLTAQQLTIPPQSQDCFLLVEKCIHCRNCTITALLVFLHTSKMVHFSLFAIFKFPNVTKYTKSTLLSTFHSTSGLHSMYFR